MLFVLNKSSNLNMNQKSKIFTPDEARRTLPLVKQIVRDILSKGFEIKTIIDSVNGDIKIDNRIQAFIDSMEAYIEELNELGCYYKDWNFEIGLVDFPAVINDKEVFLCWRSDEEYIIYYHDPKEGYPGRKKIPGEYLIKETNLS